MRILISGANGFIGLNLSKQLYLKGHEIFVLCRSKERANALIPFTAKYVEWDFNSPIDLSPYQLDGIIHLAGEPIANRRWTNKQKKRLYSSRVNSTNYLANAAKDVDLNFFFNASAVGIYGDRQGELIDESSNLGNDFLSKLCIDWEAALAPLQNTKTRLLTIRTGIVLGTDEGALKKLVMLCRLGLLSPIGSGKQYMSWIHIDDWVQALLHCMERTDLSGPINFVMPKAIQHKRFMNRLTNYFDTFLLPSVPSFIIKLGLGEMSKIILDSQNIIPKKLLDSGFSFKFKDFEEALEDLYPYKDEYFHIQRDLFFNKKIEDIFDFFTSPYNLEKITPDFLNFKVIEASHEKVTKGSRIKYRLKLHGLPLRWLTDIEDFETNSHFTDNQLKGPYKVWHHQHIFKTTKEGCIMQDHVRYKLPFAWFGKVVAYIFVNKDVNKIFDYRTKILKNLFYDSKL